LGDKRGIVLTRSTFIGVGQWAAHWLGDNYSNWGNLRQSIIGLMAFNTFGVPYSGADICGFGGDDVTEELCTRWQQLGAFYPFSRNHNAIGKKEQDPGIWGELSKQSTRDALNIRYTLLPYLYTLFYQHINMGHTVARALWHEFPTDQVALGIDRQFMWGSGLLITPVLDEGTVSVNGYFPLTARWYSYYDGREIIGGNLAIVVNNGSQQLMSFLIILRIRKSCCLCTL
jgi:alpha-glucosidase (family GH31 glycosyl hydrolase)